jgi:chromosome partitioning protein
MTRIVAVCNQKGGVGKTTLTINLGAALADLGKRVLLIDLDPQGHLTEGVGLQDLYLNERATLHDALVGNGKAVPLPKLIRQHPTEPFAVIPSTYELMLAEQALFMARNREHKLKGLVADIDETYEWVLIDCPPVLGNLTDNALNAARRVIIPIQAEATSVRALELLFDQIESVERGLNIQIEVLAVVPNLVQDSAMSKRILADLRQAIPTVIPFELRKRVMLQAAWSAGSSIFAHKPQSNAEERTRQEIAELYRKLARFVMARAEEGGDRG